MATHSRILAWEIPWTEEPGVSCHFLLLSDPATQWLNPRLLRWQANSLLTEPPGMSLFLFP